MKTKVFLTGVFTICTCCTFLFNSCGGTDVQNMHTKYSVLIFKFKDNSNMNNVIARDISLADYLLSQDYGSGIVHISDLFCDRSNKDTYFFEYDSIKKYGEYNEYNQKGYKYYNYYGELDSTNMCDFAKAPKYIELHDGYYMWYPYVFTNYWETSIKFYNITWDELCNNDSLYFNIIDNVSGHLDSRCVLTDTILPIGDIFDIFEKACYIDGVALERHSHKKINKMTIQDIIDVCNFAIDNIDELTCGYDGKNQNFVIIH